jgi:hypothetical protein
MLIISSLQVVLGAYYSTSNFRLGDKLPGIGGKRAPDGWMSALA